MWVIPNLTIQEFILVHIFCLSHSQIQYLETTVSSNYRISSGPTCHKVVKIRTRVLVATEPPQRGKLCPATIEWSELVRNLTQRTTVPSWTTVSLWIARYRFSKLKKRCKESWLDYRATDSCSTPRNPSDTWELPWIVQRSKINYFVQRSKITHFRTRTSSV